MRKFLSLLSYDLLSICVSRWFWFYLVTFNIQLYALRYFSNRPEQTFITTLSSVLYFHLVSVLIFAVLCWQNSSAYISLVLSQPVNRRAVFWARQISFSFSVSLFTGVSLLVQMATSLSGSQLMQVMVAQTVVQWVAASVGFLIAICIEDRVKAVAVAACTILLFCFALDGLSLWVMINYSAYPLEKLILTLSFLNPLTLLKYQSMAEQNASLWIGYAGLLLSRVWKSGLLQMLSAVALCAWALLPVSLAWWRFTKKDF